MDTRPRSWMDSDQPASRFPPEAVPLPSSPQSSAPSSPGTFSLHPRYLSPADENLPEVVPSEHVRAVRDAQAIDADLAHWRYLDENERDKYAVKVARVPEVPTMRAESGPYGRLQTARDSDCRDEANGTPINSTSSTHWDNLAAGERGHGTGKETSPVMERHMCGMKRKLFIVVMTAALIVVAVGVGAGVGGTMANMSRARSEAASPTVPRPDGSPTINNETDPQGARFQGFSAYGYQGQATDIFQTEGFQDLPFDIRSYVWKRGGTNCCITFCTGANRTSVAGYWCQTRYREQASDSFNRVNIWCGNVDNVEFLQSNCVPEESPYGPGGTTQAGWRRMKMR